MAVGGGRERKPGQLSCVAQFAEETGGGVLRGLKKVGGSRVAAQDAGLKSKWPLVLFLVRSVPK